MDYNRCYDGFIYIYEELSLKIIMKSRVPTVVELKTKLGLNQRDLTITKEHSVLAKIMKKLTSENILLQHSVLSYKIDFYFLEFKLAIEIDANGHKGGNIDYEIRRQKAIEKERDWEFIRSKLGEKNFDMDIRIDKIPNYIVKPSKKLSTDKTTRFTCKSSFNKNIIKHFNLLFTL